MNNMFISSAKKDEVVENFAKSKREELEKMIPGFVDDRKYTDIVLDFYERGIREGAQMMLGRMTENVVDGICISNGEYTRTDAFIEKACEFLKSYRQGTYDGMGYIAGVVNDKTIEDFKNYMKGE